MVEYDKDAIVYPYITSYLRKEIPERCGILKELEDYAEKNSVPIVQPETAKFLETLMCLKRPVRILEVGYHHIESLLYKIHHLVETVKQRFVEYLSVCILSLEDTSDRLS